MLLDEVERALEETARDWTRLGRALRIVVPSTSLRRHVAAALLRRHGRSLLGVRVQTLHGVACEALDRAATPRPCGEALLPVWVRRHLSEEPRLSTLLQDRPGGADALSATVRDFLDAGIDSAEIEPLAHLVGDGAGTPAVSERAAAVLRVAARVARAGDHLGGIGSAARLRRAAELIESRGSDLLPTRALWLHGFADVTGIAWTWMRALIRQLGARVIVDRPLDPAAGESSRREAAFTAPFVAALASLVGEPQLAPADREPAPRLELVQAPGSQAEARAVAESVRALLDTGRTPPERIAIVARRLSEYRGALEIQLERLGIPFSTQGLRGVTDAAGRRALALADVLSPGASAPLERWLDAFAGGPAATAELRLAWRQLGLRRLEDVRDANLHRAAGEAAGLSLRVPEGIEGDADGALQLRRLRVGPERLAAGLAELRALLGHLRAWPPAARVAEHRATLQPLVGNLLGWRHDPDAPDPGLAAFEACVGELPEEIELGREEVAQLVSDALRSAALREVAGGGAGVQVLGATEARGTTAAHLFLLGLNRQVFPRAVAEDPLLPDGVRRRLQSRVPWLPLKQRGREEERHLFAELLSASDHVCISWQTVHDDGAPHAPSPLVVRLRHARPDLTVRDALPVVESAELASPGTGAGRRGSEILVAAALREGREGYARLLPVALEDTLHELPSGRMAAEPVALARTRLAVLRELDPPEPDRVPVLGPYYGFLGPAAAEGMAAGLAVTGLERLVRCPWAYLLSARLGLESPPDPLATLEALDGRARGVLVHAVLEEIAASQGAAVHTTLEQVLERSPVPVSWPARAELERRTQRLAEVLLAREGLALPGLVRVLTLSALAALDVARELDWPADATPLPVLGCEVTGRALVADGRGVPRPVRFQADRVHRGASGVCLTDYKTGKGPRAAKDERKRRARLLEEIRRGARLQAPAYLSAARLVIGEAVAARYLYLGPDLESAQREQRLSSSEEDWSQGFETACRTLWRALDAGACPPRLVEPEGRDPRMPRRCEGCEVRLACLQGESRHRSALWRWERSRLEEMERSGSPTPEGEVEAAAHALWMLPVAELEAPAAEAEENA